MKKRLFLIPAIIATCCIVGIAGCSSGSTAVKLALDSNWYNYTKTKGIQDYFNKDSGSEYYSPEILHYDVTLDDSEDVAYNASYKVNYEGGKYTTTFYATTFDTGTLVYDSDDYRETYSEAGTITAYYYKTELTFDAVTFTYTGTDATGTDADTATYDGDKAITECYFLSCEDYLRPLYSRQEIVSHSPAVYTPGSIDEAVNFVDCTYTTYYTYDGYKATVEYADNLDSANNDTTAYDLDTDDTFFDNSSMEVSIRAMSDLSSSLSQSVNLFVPKAGMLTYYYIGEDTAMDDDALASVSAVMAEGGLFATATTTDSDGNVTANDTVGTVAVSVEGSGNMAGVYQTYWFTEIENRSNNTGRATMLAISSPLAYNLGTLNYTLSSIESTLWDGVPNEATN
ncbi:MAG: hypothetical protein LUD51_03580 [Clostridia bacterium]|nr:hypothetical protein [Clostridia bacterium]